MNKNDKLREIAVNWFKGEGKGLDAPVFSCLTGMAGAIFNDNNSADEIEFYLIENGEKAGFSVEPADVVNATLEAQKELGIKVV